MKSLIVAVRLSFKTILVGSPSTGETSVKTISSCKTFGGPVKPVFSTCLLVLKSGKGPKVIVMSDI